MEEELYEWWFSEFKELPFTIVDHGEVNLTDGPDLKNVVLEIDGVRQSGPIELDYKSSYWQKHGHFQNHRFQDVLLHITMHPDIPLVTGFIPKFSYSLEDHLLSKNERPTDFWERKFAFIKSYEPFYSPTDIFELLFARTLGYYYNRDVMTYLSSLHLNTKNIQVDNRYIFLKSQIDEFQRATRPNNRLNKRLEQYLELTKTPDFLKNINQIIRERLPFNILLKEMQKETNSRRQSIGKERLTQWLFNAIIPFELYFKNKSEVPYRYYLDELINELKQSKAISSFHH